MTTKFITKFTTIFTVLIAMTAVTATANADDHIDRMAVRIQKKARTLLKETVHYRHTPSYRRLFAETNSLYRLATHIHDVTHFEGNLVHLQADLRDMDAAFHNLEGLFDAIEHSAAYGAGHIHGNTAHVKRTLNSIERDIHHIRDDVAQLQRVVCRPTYERPSYTRPNRPAVYGTPVYPTRGSGYHGGGGNGRNYGGVHGRGHGNHGRSSGVGFSIGGGSTRIEFRF